MLKKIYHVESLQRLSTIIQQLKRDHVPIMGSSDANGILLEFTGEEVLIEINPILTLNLMVRFNVVVFSRKKDSKLFKELCKLIEKLI